MGNLAINVTDSNIIPDDLVSVTAIKSSTLLPIDSAVHDAESEDANIHKVSKILSESLVTDVVTKVKNILDFDLESVKRLLTLSTKSSGKFLEYKKFDEDEVSMPFRVVRDPTRIHLEEQSVKTMPLQNLDSRQSPENFRKE